MVENHERKVAFSIAFEPTKLKRIKELAHRIGANSVGEFVREAVHYHMEAAEDIIKRLEREEAAR